MSGHKNIFAKLISFPVLILIALLAAEPAGGQVPTDSKEKVKAEEPAKQQSGANALAPSGPEANREKTEADPTKDSGKDAEESEPKAQTAGAQVPAPCRRMIKADVVALSQPIMLNRLGATIPDGMIFALRKDVEIDGDSVSLKEAKRPRPLVLRANVGDCLQITLTNFIPGAKFGTNPFNGTSEVSLHVQGLEWVTGPKDDGSFVGKNESSLASVSTPSAPKPQVYTLYARQEGTFLLYTLGDTTSAGRQLTSGLFGAVNVAPAGAEWYRSQVTADELQLVTTGRTSDGHPVINYDAVYPAGHQNAGLPILKMLSGTEIVKSDLTAIITGPRAGRFPGTTGPNNPEPRCDATGVRVDPLFCENPASPDRKQPYRELTIIYHGALGGMDETSGPSNQFPIATQAFPIFSEPSMVQTLLAGQDAFAINYGTGGIGAEVYANRIGVGPMAPCATCKFEEFFLSAWTVGDPAQLVDIPANAPCQPEQIRQGQCTPTTGAKATKAFFSDDPSNVYHSYTNDHVKFRILHGGWDVTHVHHQHAHQWLQSPNSSQSSYLDSQMISPGSSYTLEMVYNGSGNRNKTVGDSIFHCHFYPHFAAGMWAMWRVHDVFEAGTYVYPKDTVINGVDVSGQAVPGSRALPDGEIKTGTPTPALVPLPTLPMAPLPAYAQIQNNVKVHGVQIPYGGQVVIGGTCSGNKINGLDVIGGCTDGQHLNGTVVNSSFDGKQMTGQFKPSPYNRIENPGFPYFIPGIAGSRAPHPPLDFAFEMKDGQKNYLDGGLPRHLIVGGTIKNEQHNQFDWSKDLATGIAIQLPEEGTDVERAAITFFSTRCYPSFFPNGNPGACPSSLSTAPQSTLKKPPTGFVLNGLPRGPQPGAPFADPAVDDDGKAIAGNPRIYKAAALQLDVTFNKQGWHFPQQRILTLWNDVLPTLEYRPGGSTGRKPEPLFIRGNSGDVIEYWHTNLVPNYYEQDAFQVRTPTDILGQHIHLVKFDVTSSDGAGNGFNYEDGTFSPDEVRELIHAIKSPGGSWTPCAGCPPLRDPQPPPAEICTGSNCKTEWMGAQTTIQRWFLDPLVDNANVDRTIRTVFTHDHFGPSTHQQAGLYAGLLVEPRGSTWTSNDGTVTFGTRSDGGPTSWQARILNGQDSYREFMLEFQDLQLAYYADDGSGQYYPDNASTQTVRIPNPRFAINAPATPSLVSTGIPASPAGTQTVNYLNEPIAFRIRNAADLSFAFDNAIAKQLNPVQNPDPMTPLLRAYQNDKVQIRVLVGAHVFSHQFNLEGPTWLAEPSWPNSGYRSAQPMGLSEHFELLFRVPSSSAPNTNRKCPDGLSQANCVDYLYSPSLDISGIAHGLWGLLRSYDPTQRATDLAPLPNNSVPNSYVSYATCPANAPRRVFNITAVTVQQALADYPLYRGNLVFNNRAATLINPWGVMYVRSEDLVAGKLKNNVPVEPLILRANAGDCIEVNLTNGIAANSTVLSQNFNWSAPFGSFDITKTMSKYVGLHPQLLSYDAATSTGINIGWNGQDLPDQVTGIGGQPVKYQWYAGKTERAANGRLTYTPVEFGALNLFPSDPLFQHLNGLFGQMIIEPRGSTWRCGDPGNLRDCDSSTNPPTTRASATITLPNRAGTFREFALMISDNIRIAVGGGAPVGDTAVNYRSEPWQFRFTGNATTDWSCMLSNQLFGVGGDPQTPIFKADIGDRVRFRVTHPFGTGTSQVFSLHGHVWQRNPYTRNSTVMGNNNLSQWIGSRDNHGSTDHFDALIDKAGGEFRRPGDYLYTVFQPLQANKGQWGIFRVGNVSGSSTPVDACKSVSRPGYVPPQPKSSQEQFIRPATNSDSRP